jgi:alpha 1,2-mannosyltransferase
MAVNVRISPAIQGRTAIAWFLRRMIIFILVLLATTYWLYPSVSTFRGNIEDFWTDVLNVLEEARPLAAKIFPNGPSPAEIWSPNVNHSRVDSITMSQTDRQSLRAKHAAFVHAIPRLSRRVPFEPSRSGIVTTAGSKNFGQAITLALMTRRAGSTLPIHIVLDSSASWIDQLCRGKLVELDVKCIYLFELWSSVSRSPPELISFQWKSVALLASHFQTILFLDADVVPVLNPDPVLATSQEPFASTGLITWPDFWTPSASPIFYEIAGDIDIPPLSARSSSESGIMIVDKSRHAETLLLALYYNYYGLDYYYPLHSQNGVGQGDKESFLQAAIVLGGLIKNGDKTLDKNPNTYGYYDVKTMLRGFGRTQRPDGNSQAMFMRQADPIADYYKHFNASNSQTTMENLEESRIERGSPGQLSNERNPNGDGLRKEPLRRSSIIQSDEEPEARTMFYHHNGVKLDFTQINQNPNIAPRNESGSFVRLWGDPMWVKKTTGRDIERELWHEAKQFYCEMNWREICKTLSDFYSIVFLGQTH